jgi:hypothetical protein
MCNGGLTRLLIFHVFKASNHNNGLVCLIVQLLAFPPSPCPPQTHKLLDKVSQAWGDMSCNLHSYCYFLLCILLLCIIPIVEVHIVVSQWVSLDTYLKPFWIFLL